MMKSNSLTNRILALVLTVVMVLGMMPSGIASAETVYVADVNGTQYETLKDAVKAANNQGGTLKMLADAAIDSYYGLQLNNSFTWDLNGCTLSADNQIGSGSATITFTGNGTVTGDLTTGTNLVIENGTFEMVTVKTDRTLTFNGGSVSSFIRNHGQTTIAGGTVKACSGTGTFLITGGTVTNLSSLGSVTVSITGGTFKSDVSSYVAEDYECVKQDTVYVVQAKAPAEPEVTYVAQVGENKYATLAEAVAAAESGATVTLLGNASGAGVVIDKDITIDFGGYTYTLTEGVGSANTPTNGLQLLSGNNVTLKNGTLKVADESADKFYILVQNYANLTVTDMTLDGTNLDKYSGTDQDSYALSNNSGNVTINGKTDIIANDDGDLAYAFDVCQFGSYAAPSVTVNTTGTINGNVDVSKIGNSTFTITGGTFTDSSVADYVVADKKLNESGTVVSKTYIAQVGEEKYETLAEAVAAAESGATVKLLGNASGAGVVINKDITIDFGGYTYTLTEGVGSTNTPTNGLQLLSGNDVVLKNGTLKVADESADKFYILVQNYADSLTVTDMTLDGTNLDKYSGTDQDSYALSNNSGNVTINGKTNIIANDEGDLAYAFDVCQFGNYAVPTVTLGQDFTGTITGAIEVSEGLENNLTITGGTYTDNVSEYVPIGYQQDENGTIVEDSVIDTEAELRHYIALGGTVTLGGNITLTGPITIDKDVTLNLNSYKLTLPEHSNYAVVVKDSLTINGEGYVHVNGSYGIGLSTSCTGGLTVNGGVFTGAGDCDYMIGAFNGKVTINGGEFTTPYCVVNSFDGYNATVEINGGKLSADYPVLGTNVTVSDAATLDIDEFLCVIGNDYYHTLASAVAGAEDGDTVTLLTDGTGAGAVVNKDITIDFAGYTYTLTEGVGSSGTPTNGLQLLSGSDVVLKNGTLEVAEANKNEFYILVQNYADSLTVTDMVLDGTNLDKYSSTDGDSYTLSNNSGNVTVNGKTDIIANDEGDKAYAFDVCKFSTYEAPTVSVATTGTVTGNIEVSEGLEENLSISSGTYTMDVSEYVVDTHAAVPDGDVYIIRLKQTGFGFEKGNEISVDYSEGLTFTNPASGGEVNANVNYTLVEGKEIATLNSGVLTITGDGVIVVRADKVGNDTYAPVSATYTLTVNKGTSSITTESDNVELTFGVQSYTMPVTTVGDGDISYAITENKSGMDVSIDADSGKITISNTTDRMGSFTVTITMADGDNYNGTSASYTVTLSYADIPADSVKLSCEEPAKNGWYKHNVTISADGCQISQQTASGVGAWNDSILMDEDGVYNLTVYLKDGDGNISAPIQISNLKIDKVAPEVAISDELSVFETVWNKLFFVTKDDVTLHVTYKDIAEAETSGIASVEVSLDGEKYTTLDGVDAKNGAFDINLPIANDSEGTQYVVLVKVTDVAGNSFEAKVNPGKDGITTIVVDKDGPEVKAEVKGAVENNNVYFTDGKNFTIEYTVTDENLAVYDAKNPIALNLKTNNTVENAISVELTEENGTEFKKVFTPDTQADGKFTITANITDTAGNPAEEVVRTYVIDQAAPDITLNHGIADENLHDGIFYTATKSYALEIVINEGLFDIYQNHGVEPKVTVNDEEVKNLTWSADGKAELPLSANGVYKISVSYDNLVHDAVSADITICVDTDQPEIELDHGFTDADFHKNYYFTQNPDYVLTLKLNEDLYEHYGVTPVLKITKDGVDYTPDKAVEWNVLTDGSGVIEAKLPLTEDGKYVITVNYGNHLHTADEQSISICRDTVKPVVGIIYRDADGKDITALKDNGEANGNQSVFAQAVTAVITVDDINFDDQIACLNDGLKIDISNNVADVAAFVPKWNQVDGIWECEIPLTVAADYAISFTCTDYALNPGAAAANLAVDIQELPDNFQFGYSQGVRLLDSVLQKLTLGFWNGQITVTVDIVDDISGVETVSASYDVAADAYADGNASGKYDSLTVVKYEPIKNGYRVTFKIPAEALTKDNQVNGNLTVTATDYAGNVSTATDGLRLIADNVKPERNVTITDPVNQTETVKYYDGNIVVGINIFEANYRYYNDAQISVTKDGAYYNTAGHTTGWYKGEANATNTLTLNEDGDYQITVTYTDGSDNAMTTWASGNLTLDTVAPVITVSNIEQNSANKDEVYGFTVTVTDTNLNVETVKPVLTAVVQGEDGLYSTEQIDLGIAQVSADGTTVTYTVENLDQDALYTLTCSAEDMSKNASAQIVLDDGEAYETVNFSVNRNGSTFGFGTDYMTDLVNQYYVYSVNEDLVIVEVNVDPIENYTVTLNGNELVEGTDYTTEQSSKDGEWSKRTYVISKSLFADEGEYNVIVSSVDKAETTAYSDIKDLGIAFVVDQTAPVLTISGLQTGGRYQTEEQTVTLIPTDDGGRLNSLKVVVMDSDGEPLTDENGNDISVRFDFSGDELLDYLSANGDMVTFTIPSGLEHQVQIVCNDCAVNAEGLTNTYDETFDRITVSQNALIIFYANKPAFYGTLGGLALLIILIVVLLKKKKKDDKK